MPRIDQRQLGKIDFSNIDGVTKEALIDIIGLANQITQGLLSAQDKAKLESLNSAGQPASFPAERIVETRTRMFVNESEKTFLTQGIQTFIHDQIASSLTWNIIHSLGRYPTVTIVDTSGNVVIGDIQYISDNQIILSFGAEFSGKAYLN
jgi:hypothetical protein